MLPILNDKQEALSFRRFSIDLRGTVRGIVTFALVLLFIVAIWQLVKALFQLDSLTLPDVSDILGVMLKPLQVDKPVLGVSLLNAGLFTLREATLGFLLGGAVGFVLAVIFAHSLLLQRGLMPFVVASQTIPILAIAPMVVVWLKADWLSVAVIAAYLTFFPVTINTLRGLLSVPPTALELMNSYAASQWQILIKLRIPSALPYIFTALKISATASVVGAIIGELPSGIQDGLGYQILNYNQYYIQGPARLWATNLMAALIGLVAFGAITLTERLVVRWKAPSPDTK
jgi:NitT/TauT family transport system permease protein